MKPSWYTRLFQQFWQIAGAVSIRVKVLGIVIGVILLLSIAVSFQMRTVLANTLSQNLIAQGIPITRNLAVEAGALFAAGDVDGARQLLEERSDHYSSDSHNTDIDYIVLENAAGEALLRINAAPPRPRPALADPDHGGEHPVFFLDELQVIEVQNSVPDRPLLLRVGFSTRTTAGTVNDVLLQLLVVTLMMVAVGFGAAFFLTWILTRPILDLVDVANQVAEGDFSHRLPRWADDEIGELTTAFNDMTRALAAAEEARREQNRLRRQYISGVILAQENERLRIARELHDGTSQSLTSLLVGLRNLKQTAEQNGRLQQIDELRGVVGTTLEEIRAISWQLRPAALDDHGLARALHNYADDYRRRHRLQVDVIVRGLEEAKLRQDVETTIYRIVQEALTNVARYAQAERVSVIITHRSERLELIVEDDGVGFDAETVLATTESLGLRGIRERAGLLGGTLTVESAPNQGTTIFVHLPQPGANHE